MRRAIPLCLSLVAALALAGSLAQATAFARPYTLFLDSMQASHGYRATVFAIRGKVDLTFSREHNGREAQAAYSVSGAATEEGLDVRFGGLGRISVKFTASQPGDNLGTFEGTIRFRGEGGYVRLQTTRAKGSLTSEPFPGPPQGASGSATASADPVYARLDTLSPRAGMLALASHPDERGLPWFYAATGERHGGIHVARSVAVSGPADSFTFDDELSTATLRPPAPFSGSATFTRSADDRGSWLGDLVVDLPGRADVPMAGPQFRARMSHELPQ